MKRYVLREYGSWGVMLLAFAAGLLVAGRFSMRACAARLALALFINSKQALTVWLRSEDKGRWIPLAVFLVQMVLATTVARKPVAERMLRNRYFAVIAFLAVGA